MKRTLTPNDHVPSPSEFDGFQGARDREILSKAIFSPSGKIYVQSSARNYDLLKRAGVKRQIRFRFYEVATRPNKLNGGLELAPLTPNTKTKIKH